MAAQNFLIIFVKVPRLGKVKTRLARDLGWCQATWWYRHHVQRLARRLGRDPRWRTVLAVADVGSDAAALAFVRGWIDVPGIAVIGQGSGDLGVRMARAFAQMPPGPVMLIGSVFNMASVIGFLKIDKFLGSLLCPLLDTVIRQPVLFVAFMAVSVFVLKFLLTNMTSMSVMFDTAVTSRPVQRR